MYLSSERVEYLLHAYIHNVADERELEEITELIKHPEGIAELKKFMDHYWPNQTVERYPEVDAGRVLEQIISHQDFKAGKRGKIFKLLPNLLRYAAILFVLAGLLFWIYSLNNKITSVDGVKLAQNSHTNIQSATQKAILTLSDGSKIDLNEKAVGTIATEGQLPVQQRSGQLIYQGSISEQSHFVVNTLTTPKGGYYQLMLNDGTKIWLNAASSISYPVAFSGGDRRVKISGEAYLEVAKNPKQPFYVETDGCQIRVLGTSFNVSAYNDDILVTTTLVEGAVNVKSGNSSGVLKPNQQSIVNKSSNELVVKTVDTEKALAWKNGYFMFDNEDIRSVMKSIERWYDIEVSYSGNLTGKTFGGTISRSDDVRNLLKNIELTETVHFKIEGRRVTVMP
ncbi:FecR family protein [Pedobacter helvus]|uniref:FecR family protein n=1 Tax=Pedobacter helvus TaxID=2563444 RepID=A0ABW9JCN8_9SPHI|nr:FecR domain-containing protein [Pedobacter ureilyticus]